MNSCARYAGLVLLLGSCGGASHGLVVTPGGPTQQGYNLAMVATSCWFGGVWADAKGVPQYGWHEDTEKRCHELSREIYGNDEPGRYLQLRAIEEQAVKDVAVKVGALAAGSAAESPQRGKLERLVRAVAAAQRESMYARRAADRVKKDIDNERQPGKLSADEVDAVSNLRADGHLRALFKLDDGEFTHDAHAIGLMIAMDRMEMARNLPKHLKVYAVERTYTFLFDLAEPDVPADATKSLKPGQWLAYLCDAAKAAGYPVPDEVTILNDRELLAWNGVLKGNSDKLLADESKLSASAVPELRRIVDSVVKRLDSEYKLAVDHTRTATKGG